MITWYDRSQTASCLLLRERDL